MYEPIYTHIYPHIHLYILILIYIRILYNTLQFISISQLLINQLIRRNFFTFRYYTGNHQIYDPFVHHPIRIELFQKGNCFLYSSMYVRMNKRHDKRVYASISDADNQIVMPLLNGGEWYSITGNTLFIMCIIGYGRRMEKYTNMYIYNTNMYIYNT